MFPFATILTTFFFATLWGDYSDPVSQELVLCAWVSSSCSKAKKNLQHKTRELADLHHLHHRTRELADLHHKTRELTAVTGIMRVALA